MRAGLRVLITGVNGFVGRHMAAHLLARHVEVLGVGRRAVPVVRHQRFRYESCDLRDRARVSQLFDRFVVDYVVHLAAENNSQKSHDDPVGVFNTNCLGTLHLLEEVRNKQRDRLKGFLVVGSSHEYGVPQAGGDVTENSPLAPKNPYGWSKLLTTSVAKMYAELYDLPTIVARTFNLIGPGATEGVCPALARQVAEIERGTRPPTLVVGNQSVARDFVDVRDAVAAYWSLLRMTPIRPGDVYNVSSGTAHPVSLIVKLLQKHALRPFDVVTDETLFRQGEPLTVRGENRKLREATGWKPLKPFEGSVLDVLLHFRNSVRKERRFVGRESHDDSRNAPGTDSIESDHSQA